MLGTLRNHRLLVVLCAALCGSVRAAGDDVARAELAALRAKVPSFATVTLPEKGEQRLRPEQALTIELLRGVRLDDDPPRFSAPPPEYDPRQSDSFAEGNAPYTADGILPFRLQEFTCEFNYGGWHNFRMADYAALHGFKIIYPYIRTPAEKRHLPPGTGWLRWGGFVNWRKWLPEHGLPEGRYDRLMDLDVESMLAEENVFKAPGELEGYLMIDMEHSCLSLDELRQQDWFPKDASQVERERFEKKYYDGYARTYIAAVNAARRAGWGPISVYGWQPYGRTWGGLEKPQVDPGADFAWNAFGKQICAAVDIVHSSVYCFYWSSRNVAYTLANIDRNTALLDSLPAKKPLRPYYWTLLHGGGGGWRWWRGQPLPDDEERAMIAMCFFTGSDGFDTWNWSGTGSHQATEFLRKNREGQYRIVDQDIMIGQAFSASPVTGDPVDFECHDVIHVQAVDPMGETVTFQRIQPNAPGKGVGPDFPEFIMPIAELTAKLRMKSEPVAAMIEGMALVKPIEKSLRAGQVEIDVPAALQFKEALPIVRRVKLGSYHFVITYDPGVVHGGEPREIVLEDFAGRAGLTLYLPADSQTRVFVLEEQ